MTEPNGKTKFEERWEQLKKAKAVARTLQSEVGKLENELTELEKEVTEKEQDHKRAVKNVEVFKEGLSELFSEEMRNY